MHRATGGRQQILDRNKRGGQATEHHRTTVGRAGLSRAMLNTRNQMKIGSNFSQTLRKNLLPFYIGLLMLCLLACADRNTPQAVSEDFIYNYYQRADQEAALLLVDLLAAEKLHDEIARVQAVRMPGQPGVEPPKIEYKQLARQDTSEHQVLFNYELTLKPRGTEATTRNVVLNTERINGEWKVVNFDEY